MSEATASQERIVSLLWLLLSAGAVGRTREFIRRHVDTYAASESEAAFERMFSRDKETLREIGVPVETLGDGTPEPGTEEGEPVRYRIDRARLALPDVEFTEDERQALLRAQSLWEGTGTRGAVVRALGRLDRGEQWMSTAEQDDLDTFGARLGAADRRLTTLEEHIREGEPVTFGYRTAQGGSPEQRVVHPWLLMAVDGQWYLVGWDLVRQGQRMYRVTRFTTEPRPATAAQRSAPVRERPADLDVHALRRSVTGESGPERAHLLVKPGRAHWLRVGSTPQGTDSSPGPTRGWDRLRLQYSRPAEFAARVAAAGPAVVVPSEQVDLRDAVAGLLDRALTAHRRRPPQVELTAVKRSRQRESDQDKVATLLAIIGLVNERGRMSRRELATRLRISDASLQTHLDTLRFCGMPERFFAGEQFEVIDDGETVEILNARELEQPLQLTAPEAHALVVGLDLVSGMPGLPEGQSAAARSARRKIVALLPEDARRTAEDAVHAGLHLGEHEQLVGALHGAVRDRSVVELTYHAAGRDEVTQRLVEPLRVEAQDGHLYLRAWCRRSSGLRNFRLDRIAAQRRTGETFTPRRLPSTASLYMPTEQETTAVLLFGHRIRDLAAGFQPSRTADLPDGSLAAEVRLSSPEYAFSAAARHGGELTVIAPADLRRRTVDWLREAARPYRDEDGPDRP